MTSQPGKQLILIHILPNISRSTNNKTMKFGQLIRIKRHTGKSGTGILVRPYKNRKTGTREFSGTLAEP